MAYETIRTETPGDGVGVVQLDRPKALNALNAQLVGEMLDAFEMFDRDDSVGCIVLTGGPRAFAAGADIKEFSGPTAVDLLRHDPITDWTRMQRVAKPILGAVSGYALGGGCELAMACDLLIAADNATFGQPEITLGIIPGAGGTQRLVRAVGKALAMEMILADRRISAAEALASGLVSRVVPVDQLGAEAHTLAAKIASLPRVAVRLAKDAVNHADELALAAGLAYEKRNFYLTFDTEDKAEGVAAFVEKRPPTWKHR